jgi:hypothetical protein
MEKFVVITGNETILIYATDITEAFKNYSSNGRISTRVITIRRITDEIGDEK